MRVGAYKICNFAAFRLLSTGQFDSTFGWGGEVVVPMGFTSSPTSDRTTF